MYIELKPTVRRNIYGFEDYFEHSDILEFALADEEDRESENSEEKFK